MNSAQIREKLLAARRDLDEVLSELDATKSQPRPLPRVMTIQGYSEHRGVSERTVYRWIKLGLPVERRGKITRIVVADADAWDESAAIARHAEIAASGGKS